MHYCDQPPKTRYFSKFTHFDPKYLLPHIIINPLDLYPPLTSPKIWDSILPPNPHIVSHILVCVCWVECPSPIISCNRAVSTSYLCVKPYMRLSPPFSLPLNKYSLYILPHSLLFSLFLPPSSFVFLVYWKLFWEDDFSYSWLRVAKLIISENILIQIIMHTA